jgi:hypothetical protein
MFSRAGSFIYVVIALARAPDGTRYTYMLVGLLSFKRKIFERMNLPFGVSIIALGRAVHQ